MSNNLKDNISKKIKIVSDDDGFRFKPLGEKKPKSKKLKFSEHIRELEMINQSERFNKHLNTTSSEEILSGSPRFQSEERIGTEIKPKKQINEINIVKNNIITEDDESIEERNNQNDRSGKANYSKPNEDIKLINSKEKQIVIEDNIENEQITKKRLTVMNKPKKTETVENPEDDRSKKIVELKKILEFQNLSKKGTMIETKKLTNDPFRMPMNSANMISSECEKYEFKVKQLQDLFTINVNICGEKLFNAANDPDVFRLKSLILMLKKLDYDNIINLAEFTDNMKQINGEKIIIETCSQIASELDSILKMQGVSILSYIYYIISIDVYGYLIRNTMTLLKGKANALNDNIIINVPNMDNVVSKTEMIATKLILRYLNSYGLMLKQIKQCSSDRESLEAGLFKQINEELDTLRNKEYYDSKKRINKPISLTRELYYKEKYDNRIIDFSDVSTSLYECKNKIQEENNEEYLQVKKAVSI